LSALDRIAEAIEAVIDRIGHLVAWLVLAVVLLLFLQHPLREYVHAGQFTANDIGQLAHATVFMVGIAYAWRWDSQVRLDIIYRHMPARTQAAINLVGTLLLLLPWLALVAWHAVPAVLLSVQIRERFPETGTPGYFLLKLLLLVFASMMALQAIAVIARSIVVIGDPSRVRA